MEDSYPTYPEPGELVGPRRYGVLIASKCPRDVHPNRTAMPWPERFLSIVITGQSMEIHNAYIPPRSSNGWIKIWTLEGNFQRLAHHTLNPRVLCGDFNAPQLETPVGEMVTWAQRLSGDGTIKPVSSRGVPWGLHIPKIFLCAATHGPSRPRRTRAVVRNLFTEAAKKMKNENELTRPL